MTYSPSKKTPQGESEVADRDVLDVLLNIEKLLERMISHLTLITDDVVTESDTDIGGE